MKKYLGIVLVALMFAFSGANAQKSELKFGHINSNELLSLMPERDSARKELQDYSSMLQQEMEAMQVEYQNKVNAYLEKQESYSDLVRRSKESEIQELQRRVQEFQMTAQEDLQQKEQELFQPIMEKAEKAIQKVAKTNGFTYVFDLSAGSVVYFSDQSVDVLPLVKKELGIE
ncbi:MAG: OmpH family outer membrane protein [Thiohalospira sp.]